MVPTPPPKPRPSRPTWRDWLPPGSPEPAVLYTRDELAARLQELNVPVAASDLQFWESAGVLPRTVRRWHKGATRSTYPEWMGYLAHRVRQLQGDGYRLQQIRPRIRRIAEIMLRPPEGHGLRPPDGGADDAARTNLPLYRDAVGPKDLRLPDGLGPALAELAFLHEAVTGAATHHVEVRVVDVEGRGTTYRVPTDGTDGGRRPCPAGDPDE